MPPMPYYFEKGPLFAVIEDYLNSSIANACSALAALQLGESDAGYQELWDMAPFSSTTLVGKPGRPYSEDFRDKWLGKGPNGWNDVMWINYEGDVNGITRLTLRTALEIALGVDAGAKCPANPTRHWPIDLFWKCGQNWFEGWVSYRPIDPTPAGHVTVVFATPSEGSTILDRPANRKQVPNSPDFKVNPTSTVQNGTEREAGLRVVTHRFNQARPSFEVEVTKVGQTFEVIINPAHYVGDPAEGLVIVRPSEVDGGVLAEPRKYKPPAPPPAPPPTPPPTPPPAGP